MTEDDFFKALKAMGLKQGDLPPTKTGTTIWITEGGDPLSVPNPAILKSADRAEALDWFRKSLAIGFSYGGGGVH